jgi:hypothetical protein
MCTTLGGSLNFIVAVVLLARAQKADGKRQVRKAVDDLVHPAGHAARHIGVGAFQQQAYVGNQRLRGGRWRQTCRSTPSPAAAAPERRHAAQLVRQLG